MVAGDLHGACELRMQSRLKLAGLTDWQSGGRHSVGALVLQQLGEVGGVGAVSSDDERGFLPISGGKVRV